MAKKEFNVDLDIKGKVSATNVPNSTGSIVTWNTTSKVFGVRTNAQIISDLKLSSSFVPYTGATANVNLGARSITSTGGFIGNATTATTLATARTINGTSFNGSANITTANWGTARNITIGNTTKSVNGSGNVAWSLSEIGASSVSHTHPISDITGLQTELNKIGNLPSLTTTNKNNLVDAINEVNENANNIEIGGRNYFMDISRGSYNGNSIIPVDGFYIANAGSYGGIIFSKAYIEEGVEYVLSFEYKTTDNPGHYTLANPGSATSGMVPGTNVSLSLIQDGKLRKKVIKFTASTTREISICLLRSGTSGTVYYKENSIKLEKGNKATDWTPAPEDQVSDWNETNSTSYSFIKNKPTIPTTSDYITTNTTQTGLTGNKTSNGIWTLGQVRKAGQTDTQILLAGGGHRPVSDFALNDGTNLTNIAGWRSNLDVYSKTEVFNGFVKQGSTPNHQGNKIYLGWSGSGLELKVDNTYLGNLWHSGNFNPAQYVPTSRTITAGNGLSGGGNLTADRTLTLATPSAITLSSTNSVAASSHTHAFTPGGTTAQYIRGDGSLATYVNTTYSAGNGLTLSGTTFSLPVTQSGSGNVVSAVAQSTNGITVTKGITAMTTSHPANAITSTNITNWNSAVLNSHSHSNISYLNSINQNLGTGNNVQFGSMELSAPEPYIDFHFGNSTSDYTSRIIENRLGGLNLISKRSLKYNIDGSAVPLLDIDERRVIIGSSSDIRFETIYLRTAFGSASFDEEGFQVSTSVVAQSFYESSLRRFKTNIKSFTKSGLDIINELEIVTFDRNDSNIKNKIGIIADDSPSEVLSETRNEVDLYKTIFIQAKAIQELSDKNDELEKRLEKLEKLLNNII